MNTKQIWGQRAFSMLVIGFFELILFTIIWFFSSFVEGFEWLSIIGAIGMIIAAVTFVAGLVIIIVLAIPKKPKLNKEKVTPKKE